MTNMLSIAAEHEQGQHDGAATDFEFKPWFHVLSLVWVVNGNKEVHHAAQILGDPHYIPDMNFLEPKKKKILIESGACFDTKKMSPQEDISSNGNGVWVVPILWTDSRRKDIVECFRVVEPIIRDEDSNAKQRRHTRQRKRERKLEDLDIPIIRDEDGNAKQRRRTRQRKRQRKSEHLEIGSSTGLKKARSICSMGDRKGKKPNNKLSTHHNPSRNILSALDLGSGAVDDNKMMKDYPEIIPIIKQEKTLDYIKKTSESLTTPLVPIETFEINHGDMRNSSSTHGCLVFDVCVAPKIRKREKISRRIRSKSDQLVKEAQIDGVDQDYHDSIKMIFTTNMPDSSTVISTGNTVDSCESSENVTKVSCNESDDDSNVEDTEMFKLNDDGLVVLQSDYTY